jgi:dynein heavy chain
LQVHGLKQLIQQLPKRAKQWAAYRMLNERTNNMAVVLQLVQDLHSKAMRDRHWRLLGIVTGRQLERTAAFSFDHILRAELHEHTEAVQDIVETANKEFKIECKLDSIQTTWSALQLSFTRHRDSDVSVPVVGDNVLDALEEHQLQLQNIAGMGKFADFSRQTIDLWQSNLGNVETILKLMAMVQRQWASLEAIFLGSMDIRSQLPDDTKRFESIDAEFKDMLRTLQVLRPHPALHAACTRLTCVIC